MHVDITEPLSKIIR